MRRFTLFIAFAMVFAGVGFGQSSKRKAIASPDQINATASYTPKFNQQMAEAYMDQSIVKAHPYVEYKPQMSPRGKTAAVNPVGLGLASNGFTILRTEQNQVFANDSLDLVAFIHRQDITTWGTGQTGENGKYRIDFSTDGGTTFNLDNGPLQPIHTNYGRYPNVTGFNNSGTSNPFDAKFVWGGATNRFPTPGWIGHTYGIADVAIDQNTLPTTENYLFDNENTLLPGGMTQGLPGEFWMTEFQWDGAAIMDSIRVMKGTYNSTTQDVDWVVHTKIAPNYDKSFDGSINAVGPNIAFSPDGMTGYIGILGNLDGGTNQNNSTFLPVFFKSTDGGDTWDTGTEVDLDMIPWISDTLQQLWVDSSGNPASSGEATTAFDYDIVVDKNGNPHMGVVIGTHAQGFSISSGLAKFYGDVTTKDGGANWICHYISPVLTFRTQDFGSSTTINMDNYCQITRSEDGNIIGYVWADSDTAQFTGFMNGVGFGEVTNLAPNLRVAARNVTTNRQTYPQLITDGDLIWEGRMLYPTTAPTMGADNGSGWPIHTIGMELVTNDPVNPCKFWYYGGDAVITNDANRWHKFNTMCLGWDQFAVPGFNDAVSCIIGTEDELESGITLHQSFPNPTTNQALIRFELPAITELSLNVTNMYGQEVAVLAEGEFAAGQHSVTANTESMAAGVYFYNLRAGDYVITKKMIVTK